MNAKQRKIELAEAIQCDPRWAVVEARDASADGAFFYSVATTGVYCRPSCASRRPRPENVCFHLSHTHAEAAGFRPCKRCRPDRAKGLDDHSDKVTAACRIIETAEEIPTLKTLADEVGISQFHFHRIFKAATGLTPRQYAAALRAQRMRNTLERSASVTEAIMDAGYGSSSRFYERADDVLGMTASRYRSGGTDMTIRFAHGECSLGIILVAESERGVCAILLGDDCDALVQDLRDRFPRADFRPGDDSYQQTVTEVVDFIEDPKLGFNLPLDIRGTAFQQRVWQALREIPSGTTVSYAEVAKKIGAPKSTRAVAQACAKNTLAVAVPCHRVIRSDGKVSGYRWGVERKRVLLDRESS